MSGKAPLNSNNTSNATKSKSQTNTSVKAQLSNFVNQNKNQTFGTEKDTNKNVSIVALSMKPLNQNQTKNITNIASSNITNNLTQNLYLKNKSSYSQKVVEEKKLSEKITEMPVQKVVNQTIDKNVAFDKLENINASLS